MTAEYSCLTFSLDYFCPAGKIQIISLISSDIKLFSMYNHTTQIKEFVKSYSSVFMHCKIHVSWKTSRAGSRGTGVVCVWCRPMHCTVELITSPVLRELCCLGPFILDKTTTVMRYRSFLLL